MHVVVEERESLYLWDEIVGVRYYFCESTVSGGAGNGINKIFLKFSGEDRSRIIERCNVI